MVYNIRSVKLMQVIVVIGIQIILTCDSFLCKLIITREKIRVCIQTGEIDVDS